MNSPAHLRIRSHAAILIVVLIWFSPWWAGGKFLAPLDLQQRMMSPWNAENAGGYAKNHFVSDAVDQYLVYRKIAERDLRREGRVGWSALSYGGTAQYANTMALYDDWTMHLHRWMDFKTAWHVGLLGQALIAAWGMFFFLRCRGVVEIWAVCGGLIWAANSQFVAWIYHRWALGSFCWVPWVLWAIAGARKGSRVASALVPVFLALSFLGGTLQHAALVALVVMLAWLEGSPVFRTLLGRFRGGLGFPGGDPARPDPAPGISIWRYVEWGLLGLCLAAFMLLPCVAAYLESNRLGLHIGQYGHAAGIYPRGPLQPLLNFISYPLHVFPSILGRCDSLDVLKLFKSELFYVAFFGSVPMVVMLWSIRTRQIPMFALLLVIAGLLLPLSPLVRILYQRLYLLAILGGVLAFAHFASHASLEAKARLARVLAIFTGLMLSLWLLASLVLRVPVVDDWIRQKVDGAAEGGGSFGFYEQWVDLRVDRFVNHLSLLSLHQGIPALLLVAGIAGLFWIASGKDRRRRLGAVVVAVAAVIDVTLFASRWVTWTDAPLFEETAESRVLEDEVGRDGRITTLIHPRAHLALTPFVPNLTAAFGVASIHGYDSIVPDGMLLPFESPDDAEKLGRFGVSHLVTWAGNDKVPGPWELVWSSKAMDLYRNPLAMPRYAGFLEAGRSEAYLRLNEESGFENSRLIHVPPEVAMVRIAENAGSGWRWRVDGRAWAAVRRGFDGSMEIPLGPSNRSRQLEMEYRPPMRQAGWLVSGLAAGYLVFSAWWRRGKGAGRTWDAA